MDSLGKLFGSSDRLKLLRLFLFNRDEAYSLEDVVERTKITSSAAKAEIIRLQNIGLLRRVGGGKKASYRIDTRFEHFDALDAFIRTTTVINPAALVSSIKRAGPLHLVLLSGSFTGAMDSGLDLLVVGEKLEERALARAVAGLEAELGREIRYASFTTEDFRYRLGVYDRLIRDVLDYPHRLLVDKIGL